MAVRKNEPLVPWHLLACKHCPRTSRSSHSETLLVPGHRGGGVGQEEQIGGGTTCSPPTPHGGRWREEDSHRRAWGVGQASGTPCCRSARRLGCRRAHAVQGTGGAALLLQPSRGLQGECSTATGRGKGSVAVDATQRSTVGGPAPRRTFCELPRGGGGGAQGVAHILAPATTGARKALPQGPGRALEQGTLTRGHVQCQPQQQGKV